MLSAASGSVVLTLGVASPAGVRSNNAARSFTGGAGPSPVSVPFRRGVATRSPSGRPACWLCAAFGSTSGAPMLHIAGHTPEAGMPSAPAADRVTIDREMLADAWRQLNSGGADIDSENTRCLVVLDRFFQSFQKPAAHDFSTLVGR